MRRKLLIFCLLLSLLPLPAQAVFSDTWEALQSDPRGLTVRADSLEVTELNAADETLALLNRRALLLDPVEGAPLTAAACEIIREMQEQEPYYRDVVRDLVGVFLMRLLRVNEGFAGESEQKDVNLPQIQPALRYIQEHYPSDIRAADLARECGLSEPHFRRVFREYVSMSPIDYLNSVRARAACRMMDQRDCPMDLVAAECGFSSVSAFTRNFKKFLGTTPYQWKLQRERQGSRLRDYSITLLRGWEAR